MPITLARRVYIPLGLRGLGDIIDPTGGSSTTFLDSPLNTINPPYIGPIATDSQADDNGDSGMNLFGPGDVLEQTNPFATGSEINSVLGESGESQVELLPSENTATADLASLADPPVSPTVSMSSSTGTMAQPGYTQIGSWSVPNSVLVGGAAVAFVFLLLLASSGRRHR